MLPCGTVLPGVGPARDRETSPFSLWPLFRRSRARTQQFRSGLWPLPVGVWCLAPAGIRSGHGTAASSVLLPRVRGGGASGPRRPCFGTGLTNRTDASPARLCVASRSLHAWSRREGLPREAGIAFCLSAWPLGVCLASARRECGWTWTWMVRLSALLGGRRRRPSCVDHPPLDASHPVRPQSLAIRTGFVALLLVGTSDGSGWWLDILMRGKRSFRFA